jgi:serine phosphatase RsbU (regulator of sigma subunit)
MTNPRTESIAFREALLKSERLRIHIVLGTVTVAFLLRTIRGIILGGHENLVSWLMMLGPLAVFVVYEFWVLRAVNRAIQAVRQLPNWIWFSNILLETLLPALAVAFLSSASIDQAYRPLANPTCLAFFVFISLSTLRLDPTLCRLSGIAAAASYLAAAAYLGWRPSIGGGMSLLSPQKAVFGYALALIIAGFAAGVVAGEIRKQVDAALREAEMRRQVDRLEHDLEVARSIQQSLLPTTMPQIEGFEIAGWNQPADQTGGDYYDWQLLADGKVLVALADVTGHGIGPALLAAVCRAYARAHFRVGHGLLDAMEQLNSALANDIGEGRFVTFVAAVCAPGSSRVEILSAGHGPLFLYVLKEDRFEEMGAQGLPLGIVATMVSEPPQVLELNRGDLLVLATDGFFEWANAQGELFGPKRLEEVIRASRERQPREIISALYQATIAFSGGTKQQDDLTVVVIKRAATL